MGRERPKLNADFKVQGRSAGYQFRRDSFGQNTLTNSPAMAPCAADGTPSGHVQGHIRHVQEVVREVILDDVAAIPAADDKVSDPMGSEALHDVPEGRTPLDLYHRLGAQVELPLDPRANATMSIGVLMQRPTQHDHHRP